MPFCDEHPKCHAVPTPFRQPLAGIFATAIQIETCVRWICKPSAKPFSNLNCPSRNIGFG